ncbi:TPA: hypothetical protein ACXJQO_003171 [Serratia marcescens]
MKYFVLLFPLISGCVTPPPTFTDDDIKSFDNDTLCKTLGEYNWHGQTVLRLTDEVIRRNKDIDQEHCYVLSVSNREGNSGPRFEPNIHFDPELDIRSESHPRGRMSNF